MHGEVIQLRLYESTCEESMSSPVSLAEPDNAVNKACKLYCNISAKRVEYYNDVARFTDLPLLVYCLFHTPIPKILCSTKFLRFL